MSTNKHLTALRLAAISVVAGAGLHSANAAVDFRFYGSMFGVGDAVDGVLYTDLLEASVFPDDPAVSDLHVAAPFFFTDEFTSTETSGELEWPQDGPENDPGGDSGSDNYGGAISGILYPPVSGTYTFHIRSDDGSALWVNSEGPEFQDLNAVDPIATESDCCDGYELTGEAASDPIDMVVGQGYAFEYIWKEGGGGDWLQIGWSLNGGPVQTIPAYYLQRDVRYGDQNADGITGPGSADEGELITFEGRPSCCLGTEFDKEGVATIQWQFSDDDGDTWEDLVDDGNIAGSQSPAVSFENTLLAWDGYFFRALVDGDESFETELTVDSDDDAPEVVSHATVGTVDGGAIRIEFDEPVDEATAMDPSNYSFSDDKTVLGVTRDGLAYLIDVGPFDNTPFDLEISGITDLAEAANEVDETLVFDFASGDFQVLIFTDMTPRIGGGSYDNLISNIERLQGDARFPGSPDEVGFLLEDDFNVLPSQTLLGGGNLSDFAGFTFGRLVVEESGSYDLAIRADDPAAFYLSTDESTDNLPPVLEPTIYEPNCCGALGDNNSGNEVITIDLDEGEYAFEAYYFEFGGGDYMEIGWGPSGGTVEHIPASNLKQFIETGELSFTADLAPVTVDELRPYSFTAEVEGSDKLGIGYQWLKNGEPIIGATGQSYSVDQADPADDGAMISVAVFNTNGTFSTVISNEVLLDVVIDEIAPSITSTSGTPLQNTVLVQFDELIDVETGEDVANYSIVSDADGSALAIESVAVSDDVVTIVTEMQQDATRYVLTVNGVEDRSVTGNATDNETARFNSFALRRGGLTALFYEAPGGNLNYFNDNYAERPGNPPTIFNSFGVDPFANGDNIANRQSSIITYFESPNSGDINTTQVNRADQYGQVIFGFVSPDVTGDYRFAIAVDDNAELWLSTSDDPEDAELIATEPAWNNNRQYDDGKQENISEAIPLVAGELYYIELIMSEGGGGDNAAVAWSVGLDGEDPPAIANGSLPIDGANLFSFMPVPDAIGIAAASPGVDSSGARVDSAFSITLSDGIDGAVNPDTIVVTVNGEEVASSVVSDNGSHAISAAATASPLPVNSEVEVVVSFETTDGAAMSVSYSFSTEDIPSLNPAWATGLDSGVDRGFNVRVVQALDSAGRGNNTAAAEAQLADPADPANLTDVTEVFEFVNFNQNIDDGSGGNGIFRGASPTEAYQIADYDMAAEGLISSNTDDDDENHSNDWAMEVKTYVAFTEAGIYTMVVNSDDGFRVTAGRTTDIEESTLELGVFSGGRGASNDAAQSVFRFVVNAPGVYALRFIGYEGGGGSSMEWSVDNGDGTYSLLNDDSGLFAYASRTGDPDVVEDVEITSISVDDAGNVTVEYTGTLQTSASVVGPYTDAAGASSPFTTTPGGDTMFFRVVP